MNALFVTEKKSLPVLHVTELDRNPELSRGKQQKVGRRVQGVMAKGLLHALSVTVQAGHDNF
jgi:hypothetical protein